MKRYFLSWFLFPIFSFAQNTLDKEIFLDSLKYETTNSDYKYTRKIQNYHTIQSEYWFADYNRSGTLEMTGKTSNRNQLVKNGLFTYFYENGNIREQCTYENDIRIGNYFSFYENGKERVEGEFLNNETSNKKEGSLKVIQFWDPDGTKKIVDGNSFYKDVEDDYTSSEGFLKAGLKEGIWNGSNKKLGTTFTEEYLGGQLIFGTSIDKNGKEFNYKEIYKEAKPAYGLDVFYRTILKKILGDLKTSVRGQRFVLSFVVNTEGNILDIVSHMGNSSEIEAKAISLLRTTDKWVPALCRGIKCSKRYFLPLNVPTINSFR